MANGYELATAYVSLAVESATIPQTLGQAFASGSKIASKAGKDMGKALETSFAKQKGPDFDKLAADAEKADKQVAASAEQAAKTRETSARKVEIAELKVQEVRERSIGQNSKVRAAEKALSDARTNGDTDRVTAAEKALADAREAVKPSSADLAAEDRLAAARDAQKLATQKAEAELDGYRVAQQKATQALDEAKRTADEAETSTTRAGNAFSTMGDRVRSALKLDFKGAFRGVEREADSSADQVVTEFDDAGDDSGAGMLDGLKGALLTGGAALGIGASFGELFQQGLESSMGEAKIQASLGLDDATATRLGKQAGAVYGGGFGESITETSDVVASAYQYLGPNVDTQWAAEMSLAMADAFGTEPQENIKAVSQMIRTGMVKDAQEGFDVLTKGYQSGADKAEDLTDTMGEYGTLFRNLGIGGADAVGLMSQGLNAGARDADKVADAFKEFSLRAVDGSDSTRGAFKAMGFDANDMAQRIAAGGDTARDATDEVLDKLRELPDSAEKLQIVQSLFGGPGEDLGASLFALNLDTAAASMGDISGATETMSDTMSAAQSPFERIQRSFSDIGTSLGGGMLPALDVFADVIIAVGGFFRDNPLVLMVAAAGITAMGIAAGISAGTFTALGKAVWAATGPVGLVITGITLLVGALVWFFTQTEVGKAILAAVVDWMVNTAWPMIQQFGQWIADTAVWLWQTILKPAWDGIKAAISATVDWMVNVAWPFIKGVWDAIAAAAVWLWQSVIQPVWTGIKTAIAIAVTAILVYIDLLKWYFSNVIAPVAMWLWNKIMKPVWNGIKSAISAVVSWFRDTAWPILSSVIGWIRGKFEEFKTSLGIIWGFIKTNVINPVVTWFRDTAWPIVSSIIEKLKSGFNTMRDVIKAAWSFVKDKAINPVATWFRDTIKPLFDKVTGGVKDAFTGMKDTVETMMNGIRDTAREPVKFLVETIIRDGIIAKYNDVAHDVFGLPEVDEKKFSVGWARGGILPGYHPMGAGDDVLTPMRSGEGVLVSEGLRDPASRQAFLGANEAAKRGVSFADFLGRGYAGGGLVKLRMPFAGSYRQGEGFGARGGAHKGIDWPIPSGTVLKAVAAGVASRTSNSKAGNKLELSIGNGLVAGYHHLSSFIAKNGQSVGRGTDVGRVGSTGRPSGPHLHFSLRKDGSYVDPLPYLGAGGAAGSDDSGGSWWNPFSGIWDSLKDKIREGVGDSAFGNALFALPKKVLDGATQWASEKLSGLTDFGSDSSTSGSGVDRWRSIATQALQMKHMFSPVVLDSLMRRMQQESGGDPRAINDWDSNARRGTPSKGLMQVIGPTFRSYAEPGYGSDIFDPLSNILASINYTKAAYGSVTKGWNRSGGYAEGGIVKPFLYDNGGWLNPGELSISQTQRPEAVLTDSQWKTMSGLADHALTTSGDINVTVVREEGEDGSRLGRRISERLDLAGLAAAI